MLGFPVGMIAVEVSNLDEDPVEIIELSEDGKSLEGVELGVLEASVELVGSTEDDELEGMTEP